MPVHVNFLSRMQLLAELPLNTREQIAARMQRVSLPRRAVALEKGVRGQGVGFVLEGRLQGLDFTLDGREAGLYFVGPGEFYGELSLIDGLAAPEYVVAIVKSEVLHLPERDARELLLSHPLATATLARRLATRVREAIAQRNLLALAHPMQRLAAQLLALAHGSAEVAEIRHLPTHQELAIMINTTRETVSRCFQTLLAQGLVKRDGERLILVKQDDLRSLLEGEAPRRPYTGE